MAFNFLWVILGSALGGALRYGLYCLWLYAGASVLSKQALYWSTVAVNLSGCLAIGLLAALATEQLTKFTADSPLWLFLVVGVLGGYTTFSAFGLHLIEMLAQRAYQPALLYISLSVVGGLLCTLLGFQLGKLLSSSI